MLVYRQQLIAGKLYTTERPRSYDARPCSPWSIGWPLGYEERRCWANCVHNLFPRFSAYVVL